MSTLSFMKDFTEATKPLWKDEPDTPRKWGNDVEIQAHIANGQEDTIHLADLKVISDFDQGHGTKALEFLMLLADKHRVDMIVAIVSSRPGFTDEQTKNWYLKRGWEDNTSWDDSEDSEFFQIRYRPALRP